MRPLAGAPAMGADFFNRDAELRLLETKVRSGTHILLAGQRRMGKTSVAKELGRRLQTDGWEFLFVDVEDAASPADVIRDIAKTAHGIAGASRLSGALGRWVKDNIKGLNALKVGVELRASGDYAWRQQGEALIRACADHESGVLLVLDELPIFLSRLLAQEDAEQAHLFLRWLRSVRQQHAGSSFALMVSGSIGMAPLVARMGLPDSINDMYSFRLRPWDRDKSVECLRRLAEHSSLEADDVVFEAVYDTLGLGIPHFVQSFFARLQDFAGMQDRTRLTVADVEAVYNNDLLEPANGHLLHYEKRLKESLDDDTYRVAMEIQAEAATQGVFAADARRGLQRAYSSAMPDVGKRIDDALDVLEHDGHLERTESGYRLPFRLLADWLRTRFRDHHIPLGKRGGGRQ